MRGRGRVYTQISLKISRFNKCLSEIRVLRACSQRHFPLFVSFHQNRFSNLTHHAFSSISRLPHFHTLLLTSLQCSIFQCCLPNAKACQYLHGTSCPEAAEHHAGRPGTNSGPQTTGSVARVGTMRDFGQDSFKQERSQVG